MITIITLESKSRKIGGWLMAAWRKEEVDTARLRQEKIDATSLGKLGSYMET